MDRWLVPLTIGAGTADATQCYPEWAAVGIDPATATPAQQVRKPCEGQLVTCQISTDGTNGGTLEIFDISGADLGVNVSSATAITDTILDAAVAAGKAKRVLVQNFLGNGSTPFTPIGPFTIAKGIAARATGATGTCTLNMVVHGCYRYLNGTT